MKSQKHAPIALFVYNRPEHARLTVEALKKNSLARSSELIVFSDGPKSDRDAEAVRRTREYIHTIEGFRTVRIVERAGNMGVARSIIEGVTGVVNEYGRIIVLEDDLVSSPYFLQFMNEALEEYEDSAKVMHISGSTYPVELTCADSIFFLRVPLCWGWATWARAWRQFEKDERVMSKFDKKMISEFDFGGTYHYWEQLKLNRSGKLDTWFVFWYATVFLNKGLALFPCESLVRNVGMDGSGVHCGRSNGFEIKLSDKPIEMAEVPIRESTEIVRQHKQYFSKVHPRKYIRVFRKVLQIMEGFLKKWTA